MKESKAKSKAKLFSTLYDLVRCQDFFGHPVRFHFNGKGPDHKTWSGGAISILVKCFMLAYFVILCKRLLLHEGDQNSVSIFRTEYDLLGEVSMKDASMSFFAILFDGNYIPVPYDENTRRYLRVEWVQVSQNFLTIPIEVNQTKYRAVPCGSENTNEGFKEFAKSFAAAPMTLCPPSLNMSMMNSSEAGISKVFQLQVQQCKPDPDYPEIECATSEEMDEFAENTIVQFGATFEQIDFTKRGSGVKPVYPKHNFLSGSSLKRGVLDYQQTNMVLNKIETYDSLLSIGFPSDEYDFYDFGKDFGVAGPMNHFFPNTYHVKSFSISDEYKLHERHIYNLLDLLGDLGGVFEVIIGAIGIFVLPFSEVSFILKALQKLYLAKTDDQSLFVKPIAASKDQNVIQLQSKVSSVSSQGSKKKKKQKLLSFRSLVPEVLKGSKTEEETKSHYPVIMNPRNRNRLQLRHYFLTSWCFRRNPNPGLTVSQDDKFSLLFKKGRKLLHEDLSIEKLIKTLRDIKIFMKEHWLDDRRRFEIQHNSRNVIDLDNLNDYLYNQSMTESDISVEVGLCIDSKAPPKDKQYLDYSTESMSTVSRPQSPASKISSSDLERKFIKKLKKARRGSDTKGSTPSQIELRDTSKRSSTVHWNQELGAIPEEATSPQVELQLQHKNTLEAWDKFVQSDESALYQPRVQDRRDRGGRNGRTRLKHEEGAFDEV